MSQHSEPSLETLQLQYNGMQTLYVEEYCFFFLQKIRTCLSEIGKIQVLKSRVF